MTVSKFMQEYRVSSRLILLLGMTMLWRSAEWGMWFATGNDRNGVEIAAILAAIQSPATFFAGWAFKIYTDGAP